MNAAVAQVITHTIEAASPELRHISLMLLSDPELGDREFESSRLLADFMEKTGFTVTRQAAGMATAFIAEFSNSSSGRRVGFCSEYDALPGIGHACGHNLIAISGVACALAMKALLERDLIKGTVVLFGTPAEETTGGKVKFVASGEINKRIDFAMMLHPAPEDSAFARTLAMDTLDIEYFGKASHAGVSPDQGINALDAFMQGWNNIAMLRQQTLPTNRMHGILLEGGKSPNVIPDYVSGQFFGRSLTKAQLAELKKKMERCFEAAAVATRCKIKMSWDPSGPLDDVFMNETFALRYLNYMEQEGVQFPPRSVDEKASPGSTDMGNVSYAVPAIHPMFGIQTTALNHTPEFTKAAGTEAAHFCALRASRCLAMTAATAFLDEEMYREARSYFEKGKPQ